MKIEEFIKNNQIYTVEKYKNGTEGAIYFICEEDGSIIYIGRTVYLNYRFTMHYAKKEFRNKPIFFFLCPIEDCKKLEKQLILQFQPKYNILGKKEIAIKPHRNKKSSTKLNGLNILGKYKEKHKLSASEMAKKAGVPVTTIWKHIYNQRSISPAIILKYMKAYDIPAQALLKIRVK